MKLIAGVLAVSAILSGVALATTTEDLSLECEYEVKILDSENYYVDNSGTRALSYSGVSETLELLSYSGKDCQKIEQDYGVSFQPNEIIKFGVSGFSRKVTILGKNEDLIGTTKVLKPTQTFKYALSNGELPWFPTIHAETVSILGKHGVADVQSLYGSTPIADIEDAQKVIIAEKVVHSLDYGISLNKRYLNLDDEVKLNLLIELAPDSKIDKFDYLNDVLLVFRNSSKYESSFSSSDIRRNLGRMINKLLNELGQTMFGTSKLEIWKTNPALFDEQIVSWVFSKVDEAPILKDTEIEEFLELALEKIEALDKVSELYEGRVLKAQYVNAAKVMKKLSKVSSYPQPHFALTPISEKIIDKILKLK